MNQVRIHGDPFGDGADGVALRSFLRLAAGHGVRCSLSLTGVAPRPCGGEREAVLDDGWSAVRVRTWLPDAEIEMIERAAATAVASTSPVVVFVPREQRADAHLLVGWEWAEATAVLVAGEAHQPQDLLDRVRAEWRWGGLEHPRHGLPERLLHAYLELSAVPAAGPVVHVVEDLADAGTDAVLGAWAKTERGGVLRIVAPAGLRDAIAARVERVLGGRRDEVELVDGPLSARHLGDAAAVLQPWQVLPPTALVVTLMASGRPLLASAWGESSEVLGPGGCHFAVEGAVVVTDGGQPTFAADAGAVSAALRALRADPQFAARVGLRARRRVQNRFVGGRAAVPPPAPRPMGDARPVALLQGPVLAGTPEGEAMRSAIAACEADGYRLEIRATAPFPASLDVARATYPELLPRIVRQSGAVELRFDGEGGWERLAAVLAGSSTPVQVAGGEIERIVTLSPAPVRTPVSIAPTV